MPAPTDYISHWDEKFSQGDWGKYPPEELVRFFGRNYKKLNRGEVRVLEVGCGPGANLWFLHREGYCVAGIDGSPSAIEAAGSRLKFENANLNPSLPDLKVGNFSSLDWSDESFDVVIDIFSLYANTSNVIDQTINEIYRVLKPGGRFFSKVWGTRTTGYGKGVSLEKNTYEAIPEGPCCNMGVSHFFDEEEIKERFSMFQVEYIDNLLRTDHYSRSTIEEFICQLRKPEV